MPDDEAAFGVEVETVADPSGDPSPRRFRLGPRQVEVAEVIDRWPGRDHLYVKLRGADGAEYILRRDHPGGRWRLVFYRREGDGARPGWRGEAIPV